ncbi:Uncharacterized protein Fot_26841 [Forsythia ovata]|uniref:Uncharacterized protein n=1 Tax=Forsythia ovata TaxID=205694 RepID=A0ABD1UEI4_9LAMI
MADSCLKMGLKFQMKSYLEEEESGCAGSHDIRGDFQCCRATIVRCRYISTGASLAADPKASGGLDLLVVGVGGLASLVGAGGDEGSSVGDSAGGNESEGRDAEGVEDFGAEDFGTDDFGAGTGDDDLGTCTGEAFGVAVGDLIFFGDGADFGKYALGAGEGEESTVTSPATHEKNKCKNKHLAGHF